MTIYTTFIPSIWEQFYKNGNIWNDSYFELQINIWKWKRSSQLNKWFYSRSSLFFFHVSCFHFQFYWMKPIPLSVGLLSHVVFQEWNVSHKHFWPLMKCDTNSRSPLLRSYGPSLNLDFFTRRPWLYQGSEQISVYQCNLEVAPLAFRNIPRSNSSFTVLSKQASN